MKEHSFEKLLLLDFKHNFILHTLIWWIYLQLLIFDLYYKDFYTFFKCLYGWLWSRFYRLGSLTLPCKMLKNGQTYYKILAMWALQNFLTLFTHFSTSCSEGLTEKGKVFAKVFINIYSYPNQPVKTSMT